MSTKIVLPNIRKLFLPDPAYVMYEGDLKGADAQVVAWEAEDDDLKEAFRSGLDVHVKNAEDMWGSEFTRLPLGSHARDKLRQNNKVAVHGSNYGASSNTLARNLNWTNHEADRWQKRWFGLHPKIKTNFHEKVKKWLQQNNTVYNAFGFHCVYFDRPDNNFTEALAWIPQSTVAINSYLGFFQLQDHYGQERIQELFQNHDSMGWQTHESKLIPVRDMKEKLRVKTPYPDPLYIPWDLKWSRKSWGDLEKIPEAA